MQAEAPDASRTAEKPRDGANGIPSRWLEVLYLALRADPTTRIGG
ncbi:hypothetical protein GCM10009779_43550 [Polymorphospora rubra]|uniref:Uncharacterized protein n=1 Tax=Polymorphospora rubra TaxID=338584 RepID=A0A810N5E3_9ACTN|nr:hypothetical protein Prubr_51810 [Polymorphospora rubra]